MSSLQYKSDQYFQRQSEISCHAEINSFAEALLEMFISTDLIATLAHINKQRCLFKQLSYLNSN